MRGNAHVRFGRRTGETDLPQGRHRAPVRPDHTHATLMLKAGVNPKVVSERLGHSSVAYTLDTYAHVLPGMQPEAAELFDAAVFGDTATNASDPDVTSSGEDEGDL